MPRFPPPLLMLCDLCGIVEPRRVEVCKDGEVIASGTLCAPCFGPMLDGAAEA